MGGELGGNLLRALLRVVILVEVEVNDLVMRGEAMVCFEGLRSRCRGRSAIFFIDVCDISAFIDCSRF